MCPPHAAVDVARDFAAFDGVYVDANAVSPATARAIAGIVPRYVDGGIIGTPGAVRIYLSGADANAVAALFDAAVVSNASALKMAYAAWTKGTAALILAIRDLAEAEGIGDEARRREWRLSQPQLFDRLASAERSARTKGWRWVGEMEEIADTFAADGLPPDGFHRAAAEIFRRHSQRSADRVLEPRVHARGDERRPGICTHASPAKTITGMPRECAYHASIAVPSSGSVNAASTASQESMSARSPSTISRSFPSVRPRKSRRIGSTGSNPRSRMSSDARRRYSSACGGPARYTRFTA